METDWCQGFAEGAVGITPLNEKVVATGTAEKVAEVEAQLKMKFTRIWHTNLQSVSIEDPLKVCRFCKICRLCKRWYFHESELLQHQLLI